MNISRSPFANPKLYEMAFLAYLMLLFCCKKVDMPSERDNNPTDSHDAPTTVVSNVTSDTIPRVPMDPGPAEPMKPALTGFELVALTINWDHSSIVDPDSLHDICIGNRYKDVILKTPSDIYENSALYFSLPGEVHRARDTLDVKMNELENYGKNARGYGKLYVARHDLPNVYEIEQGWNPCGMSIEDYEWFTMNGWTVVDTNLLSKNYKPFDTVAQWNHKSQLDSIRPALYKKQMQQFDTAKYNRRRQNLYKGR